jgi:hypothetical protein
VDNTIHRERNFVVRNANLNEMPFLLTLATEEGWNPGLHDAGAFFATDPKGFFIGELDGIKVGCISSVAYSDTYGFMGFFIIKPEYRHSGLGLEMTKTVMASVGNRIIGLNAESREAKNYQKSGFIPFYKTLRFQGSVVNAAEPSPVEKISNIPFEQLLGYDTAIFGVSRENFLKKWIAMTNSYGYAIVEKGALCGYGVIRSCVQGYRIGPLFADTPQIAFQLLQELVFKIGNAPFYIDIPEINVQAIAMAKKMELIVVSETIRMYTSTPPLQTSDKIYGVTTQELG